MGRVAWRWWRPLQVAASLSPADVVVVLLPDSGRGYLSKIFNDEWMADYGFLAGSSATTVADVLKRKGTRLPEMVHLHPTETVREAIDVLREYGVSQVPVVRAEPPVMSAEVIGSVVERDLLDALFSGPRRAVRCTREAHLCAAADDRRRRASGRGDDCS